MTPDARAARMLNARSWEGRLVMAAAALAMVGTLIGTVAIIRSGSARSNVLRRAEIRAAVAPGVADGVVASPQALLHGQPADPSEYAVSARLRLTLHDEMGRLLALWPTPESRRAYADASTLDALTVQLMALIAAHRLGPATVLEAQSIVPLGATFAAETRRIGRRLEAASESAEAADRRDTILAVGSASIALLLLLVALTETERRRARQAGEHRVLAESERLLNALVHNGSDMITVVGADGSIVYQGGAAQAMLGHPRQQLEGTLLSEWLHPDDAPTALGLCAKPHADARELRLRHRDGTFRTCEARATSLSDHPEWGVAVLNIWDISERKALEERLRHRAFHDALTDLPNRALFRDRVEQALRMARRHGHTAAVMVMDLDRFRELNDALGHHSGDQLLQEIGLNLSRTVRDSDTVARLGGDEFAILAPIVDGAGGAVALAQRALHAVRRQHRISGVEVDVDARIGIALYPEDGNDADTLLRRADIAMYASKQHGELACGPDSICTAEAMLYAPEHDHHSARQLALVAQLRRAIGQHEIIVYYQPQADLDTGLIRGVEALVRWEHPERGLLAPDSFIPLAERTGMIRALTSHVLDAALQQCRCWRQDGFDLSVAVNVTGRDLLDLRFADEVAALLRRWDVEPTRLQLEITENTVLADAARARSVLLALNDLGVRVAIDDFGSGNSSLAYLKRLPIDVLKIDKSFVLNIDTSEDDAVIVRSTIELGHNLGLKVVAEGVETTSAWDSLRALGCDIAQGYYLSRPVPAPAIGELVRAGPVTRVPPPAPATCVAGSS